MSHRSLCVRLIALVVAVPMLLPGLALSANPEAEPGTQLVSEFHQTERLFKGQAVFAEAYRLWQLREYDRVVAMIQPLAESGNASAQFLMGGIYSKGEGVPQDDELAVSWWRKAALQGVPDAQNELGVALLDGTGIMPDPEEAVIWYRRAAESGLAVAQVNLGLAYWEGRGVPRDSTKAVTWFRKAAEQGLGWAQFYLGSAYWEGIGVARNPQQAVTWWLKAANQGYPEAQNILGTVYLKGNGIRVDNRGAAYWFAKAAKRGHAVAERNLQSVLPLLKREKVRNPVEVRARPDRNSAVVRTTHVGELAYEIGRTTDWVEVYLQDGFTLGYISAGQATQK